MVKLEDFAVEQWMDKYETTAKFNTAETCCASVSVDDLRALSEDKETDPLGKLQSTKLTYGAIRGSDQLRDTLSNLYSAKTTARLPKDNILITAGAIQANFLVLYSLLGPGDHVICHYPTYQQLYSVPASLGAEVSLWKSKEADGWQLDLEELKAMIKPNTKMIIINNPQNPTGAIIPHDTLKGLVNIARESSITIFSDEAYSLAGLRVGWIASRSSSLIEKCANSRDYTAISVGQIGDAVASFALAPECIHNLLRRNIELARTNLAILEKFIDSHRWACDWIKPKAGTTAFVRFTKMGKPINDVAFCETLQEKSGVMFVPGSLCFGGGEDFQGYVRIGYACETEVLEKGLEALRIFMEDEYENVPSIKKVKSAQ
ncbi:hypothetical protein N7481_013257 [Penicillium waksmanii]|uniref:uncharacterized protein n=1 Tax=Penicillium waksmanii TaxID=69791 RepID=UPI0025494D9D|nr:uncharacterized protein N7481_013257 [Penicillium waksmanii]KAJ5966543.1 hypothetical protein N7481_013257 [Penicillium waksmanii]